MDDAVKQAADRFFPEGKPALIGHLNFAPPERAWRGTSAEYSQALARELMSAQDQIDSGTATPIEDIDE